MSEDGHSGAGAAARGGLWGVVAALCVVGAGIVWWALSSSDKPPAPVAAISEAPAPAKMPEPATTPASAPAPAVPEPAVTPVEPSTEPVATAAASPDAPPAAKPAEEAPAVEQAAAPEAPAAAALADVASFDALRVSPDGALTLAGKTQPGAQVEVLLDGKVIDTVTSDPTGAFASVVLGDAAALPRALTVRVTGADGVARTAKQSLTVAPSPLAVAQAATAAGDTPEQVAEQVAAAQTLAEKPIVSDASGAHVLAAAADALVIDTLAFDGAGRISLSGRGAPASALLRAYLDNDEAGLVQAAPDGSWQMQLPAAKQGHHQLRIDAIDAAGKVLARAETGFDAVPPADLQAAQPASAAAQGVSVAGAGNPRTGMAAAAAPRMVTVAKGSTLWAIARDTYGDPYLYVRLFEANRGQIRDPNLIYPGQVFTLPE